jgi:Secretion system C-terminal sorting domain/PKD domain
MRFSILLFLVLYNFNCLAQSNNTQMGLNPIVVKNTLEIEVSYEDNLMPLGGGWCNGVQNNLYLPDTLCDGGAMILFYIASGQSGISAFWQKSNSYNGPFVSFSNGANLLINSNAYLKCTITCIYSGDSIALIDSVIVISDTSPVISLTASSTSICKGDTLFLQASGASIYNWTPYIWSPNTITPLSSNKDSAFFVPSCTTIYQVWGKDAHGCTSISTKNIVVHENPKANITGFPKDTICPGIPIVLKADTTTSTGMNNTYLWSNGAATKLNTINPQTATTNYFVTITNSNGCVSSDSISIHIYPILKGGFSCSANGTNVAINDSAENALNYFYDFGNGYTSIQASPTINYTSAGSYILKQIVSNGCDTITTIKNLNVVINHLFDYNENSLSVYLNQSLSNEVTVKINPNTIGKDINFYLADVPTIKNEIKEYQNKPQPMENNIDNNLKPLGGGNCIGTPSIGNLITPNSVCSGGVNAYLYINVGYPNSTLLNWQKSTSLNGPWTSFSNSSSTNLMVNSKTYLKCSASCFGSSIVVTTPIDSIIVLSNPAPITNLSVSDTSICKGDSLFLQTSGALTYTWIQSNVSPLSIANNNSVFALPLHTTTYHVIGTDAVGCTSSVQKTVSVYEKPKANITVFSNDSICPGTSISLNADTSTGLGKTYLWSNGATTKLNTVNPQATTNYSVIVTHTNGCNASDNLTINVHPKLKGGFGSINNGSIITIVDSAKNAVQYFYDFGNGTTSLLPNPTVTYATNGVYNVQQVVMNFCDTITTNKTITIGLNHILYIAKNQITISPNPASCNEVTIKVNPNTIGKNIIIYSTDGVVVQVETILEENTKINIANLLDGLYYIRVGNNATKLIKGRM